MPSIQIRTDPGISENLSERTRDDSSPNDRPAKGSIDLQTKNVDRCGVAMKGTEGFVSRPRNFVGIGCVTLPGNSRNNDVGKKGKNRFSTFLNALIPGYVRRYQVARVVERNVSSEELRSGAPFSSSRKNGLSPWRVSRRRSRNRRGAFTCFASRRH